MSEKDMIEEFDEDDEEEELPYISRLYESDDGESWIDISTADDHYDVEVCKAGCYGTENYDCYSVEEVEELVYSTLGYGIDIDI